MTDPVDLYSNQFQINMSAYDSTLNFLVSNPIPPAPGSTPQAERVATIRMSLEHLKVLAFLLHRQLIQFEGQAGVQIPIPMEVLNALRIGLEDWQSFWRREEGGMPR